LTDNHFATTMIELITLRLGLRGFVNHQKSP
jgi:hypothetical protein